MRDRLLECFHSVFAAQPGASLLSATPDTIADWDSTRHFLLLQSIEEEFEVRIPERTAGELLSFADFENYLQSKLSSV
ncbi:MAG TPA: hypothetical protein VHZ55_01530 [Bryobacteraceae bacterium]|jgi:acyl carrier protein|nr:hypothetical protein [Bryobacteraceae bacterium]